MNRPRRATYDENQLVREQGLDRPEEGNLCLYAITTCYGVSNCRFKQIPGTHLGRTIKNACCEEAFGLASQGRILVVGRCSHCSLSKIVSIKTDT